MSAAGGLLGRFVGTMGGPQAAVLIVAGGLIAGALGGGAIAGGVFSGSSGVAAGELGVYPCPNVGPALTSVKSGQKMLVTGRTEDGTWLRIHFPLPGRTEAWVPANPVTVNGSMSSVPVATCVSEVAAASPSFAPGETMTAIQNNSPSPSPTPVPTPSPTQNGAPSVTALTVSTAKISYDTGSYCPTAVKKVTFTAKAGDSAGVTGVTLFWRTPGASTYAQLPMSQTAGTATSGTWQVTLDTTANGITKAGTLAYYAVATDAAGATGRAPAKGASGITVAVCANTGPSITGVASSSGSSLYWNPLGVVGAACQTATDITAAVGDVDGVKSVTLFFKRPGSATWSSKAMNNTTVPGKWYANLDTLGDKISIPTPPTGALSWYIKAVDGKNVASQTKAATITVRRCDSPATFFVNSVGTFYVWCPPPPPPGYNPWVNLVWSFSITDPDAISSATLSYTIVSQTGVRSSQTLTVKPTGQRFSIKSGNIDGATFNGSNSVTWTITTTDQYGGKSSQSSKATVTISVC